MTSTRRFICTLVSTLRNHLNLHLADPKVDDFPFSIQSAILYALLKLICYAFVQPCSFGRSLSIMLAERVINHFCTRYAIFLCSFEYCHLLELYVNVLPSIGHSFHSRSGIRDVVVPREKIPSDPVAGCIRGMVVARRSEIVQTENTVRHTKYGRIRGMVVGEGDRSTGVLLYMIFFVMHAVFVILWLQVVQPLTRCP